MSSTRTIEMGVAFDDHTWHMSYISIPIDTPDDQIERVAIEVCTAGGAEGWTNTSDIVGCFIYYIPDLGDYLNQPD